MTDLTADQLARIATLDKRSGALMAFFDQLASLETPASSSGRVYSPTLLSDARLDLRRAVLSARLAIEQPEAIAEIGSPIL